MKAMLDEQVLVVTGAASGVGRAIAEQAVAAGATGLVLSDLNKGGLQNAAAEMSGQAHVLTVVADLSDPETPTKICSLTKQEFGRIDGLVNAAGLTTRASFVDGSIPLWDHLFAVNARAPFFLMQGVIADMLDRGRGGAIVNIQSINAHCGASDLAIYSATKGALTTLTKNATHAHLKDRIRVNGINLSWTQTEAEHDLQANTLGGGADWADHAAYDLPLGQLLLPQHAARLAVYLLSPALAPMTGVSIDLEQSVIGAPC